MTDQEKDLKVRNMNEPDPLYVDKGEEDMDALEAMGQLAHSSPEDSRINDLDAITFEDHQQLFGSTMDAPTAEGSEEDTSGPAANVKQRHEDEV